MDKGGGSRGARRGGAQGVAYPGEHVAIVDRTAWEKLHAILAENRRCRASRMHAATLGLLKGLIFGPGGKAMAPSHTRRRGPAVPVLSDRDEPEARPR